MDFDSEDVAGDMSELDALLEGAVQRQGAVDALTKARNTRLGAKVGSEEWRVANEYVRAWERKNEWHGVTYQARLVVDVCECGGVAETFEGFFSVLRHRVKSTIEHKRVRVEDVAHVDMSRIDRVTERRHVSICIECWMTKGKQDEKESGATSTTGFETTGHVEGTDGHGVVVGGRAAGAVWPGDGVCNRADQAGFGPSWGRGE